MQMLGMLLGGIFWGVLGDRRGRLSVLFGSIILYSLANLANGVPDRLADADRRAGWTPSRSTRWIRFIAGVGLAGELGAGHHAGQRIDAQGDPRLRHHHRGHGGDLRGAGGGDRGQDRRLADGLLHRRRAWGWRCWCCASG